MQVSPLYTAIVFGLLSVLLRLLQWFIKPLKSVAMRRRFTREQKFFKDPNRPESKEIPFPSLFDDQPTKFISIVAPAYQEEKRIDKMLKETFEYLNEKKKNDPSFTFELIVVDDGSTDKTSQITLEFSKPYGTDIMRVLTLKKNMGKGGAIQNGMLCCRGENLLMADADGATQISDLDEMINRINAIKKNGHGIAVGSRAHLEERAVSTRKWYRNIAMYAFHLLVYVFAVKTVKDTQCGFKLFTRDSAKWVFLNQHLHGWAFDAELLYIAERKGFPIAEVAVNWDEIPGSKLNVITASLTMARELVILWFAYTFGFWKIETPKLKSS